MINYQYYLIQEMCKLIENHCQILKIENSWPAEFNCENETLYPAKLCKVKYLRFSLFILTEVNNLLNNCYNLLFVYSS